MRSRPGCWWLVLGCLLAGCLRSGPAGGAGGGGATSVGSSSAQGGATSGGGTAGAGGTVGSGGATGGGGATSSGGASAGGAAGAGDGGNGGSTVLAATPPMGWSSWNRFHTLIDETLIKAIADAMVSSGMKAAGYQYVNLDDGWSEKRRDADDQLAADGARFPGGMKALADYVHERGLRLGIYGDRGATTCAGYPGSWGHESQDVQTFAAWGVDFLKYDNCGVAPERDNEVAMQEDYAKMAAALAASGRPIVYSICAWRFRDWMPGLAQLWRSGPDINDRWLSDRHSVISIVNKNGGDTSRYGSFSDETNPEGAFYPPPGVAGYARPGHWNDPDMLEVGNGGMTATEYRSHFSLWAIMAAPLIAGNDLTAMDEDTLAILLNREVIAVDQDPLGIQGQPISADTRHELWSKPLSAAATYAVVLFNRDDADADMTVTWAELGLASTTARVRDLWAKRDLGSVALQYTTTVPGHGVVMLRVAGE